MVNKKFYFCNLTNEMFYFCNLTNERFYFCNFSPSKELGDRKGHQGRDRE